MLSSFPISYKEENITFYLYLNTDIFFKWNHGSLPWRQEEQRSPLFQLAVNGNPSELKCVISHNVSKGN